MKRRYLKEVFELQRIAGIKEMDTPADAERDVYIDDILHRIEKDIKELQDVVGSEDGPASVDYIIQMIQNRMSF